MARFEWTTERGNLVAIEVERVEYTVHRDLDGEGYEEKRAEKRITRMTLNGAEVESSRFDHHQGNTCVKFRLGGREGLALLPTDISESIWAEERAAQAAASARAEKLDAERRKFERFLGAGETHR
ncbi:MAG: hypothetical protein C4551_03150 [Bacillota bacterium]|nr:MAG: hypothetical protein C4551_03150 [Bacillota bacterium]